MRDKILAWVIVVGFVLLMVGALWASDHMPPIRVNVK